MRKLLLATFFLFASAAAYAEPSGSPLSGYTPLPGGTSGQVQTNNGANGFSGMPLQGNGSKVQLSTGSTTTNDCVKFDANGNVIDAGSACGSIGANPTQAITGAAVNGSASTFMRSDAAPALGTITQQTVVNLNAVSAPSPVTGTVLQVVGADAANGFIENDTFGATPIFIGRRADGTGASPTAVQSAETLAGFSARPYDGTTYASASTGNVQAVASENFTAGHHGTDVLANCTAITTTTTGECGRFKSSGFTIPTGSTYQINGTQIAASNLSNGVTGSGSVVLAAGPTLTGTSVINAATFGGATLGSNAVSITGTVDLGTAGVYGLGASGVADAGLSRDAAGVVDVGNGAQGDQSGTLRAAKILANGSGILSIGDATHTAGVTNFGGLRSSFGGSNNEIGLNWAAAGVIGTINSGLIGFTANSANGTLALDSGFSRISAGVIGVGTGAQGSVAGALQAASIALGGGSIGSDVAEFNGTTTHNGNVVVNAASFGLSGNISGSSIFGTNGIRYKNGSSTLNDTTSSGTIATNYDSVWGGATLTATGATTLTLEVGNYFKAPTCSTNVTCTNLFALGADSAQLTTLKVGTGAVSNTPGNGQIFTTGLANFAGNTFQVGSGDTVTMERQASFGFTSGTSNAGGTLDTILTRAAAATWQMGVDAAAPVAQTFQCDNVLAGNANTAAPNCTFAGGKSNGSGSGDLIFQTTLNNAASGTQNTLATALTLKGGTQNAVFVGSISAPNGVFFGSQSSNSASNLDYSTAGWQGGANERLTWTSAQASGTQDTGLSRDSAGVIDVGTGPLGSKAGSLNLVGAVFTGQITAQGMTQSSAAQSGAVCNNTGGTLTYDATLGCLASLEELKDRHGDITGALAEIGKLKPFWASWKVGTPEYAGDPKRQFPALGAHQVESVDTRLTGYGPDGKLRGVRYANTVALLVAGQNEEDAKVEDLRATIHTLTTQVNWLQSVVANDDQIIKASGLVPTNGVVSILPVNDNGVLVSKAVGQ